jgi:hypothetical protein
MSQNVIFKVGDLVKLPDSNKIAKVFDVDDEGKVISVELDGKIITVIDKILTKVSLVIKLLVFIKSLFKI